MSDIIFSLYLAAGIIYGAMAYLSTHDVNQPSELRFIVLISLLWPVSLILIGLPEIEPIDKG